MGRVLLFVLLLLFVSSGIMAQDISTDVYSSEDELQRALDQGEITTEQYNLLLELMLLGPEMVLDNQSFDLPKISIYLDTISQQKKTKQQISGSWRYGYYHEVEKNGRARYSLAGKLLVGSDWKVDLAIRRELSGYERLVYRSINYQPNKKFIKSVTFGNFSTKFGLGSVIGYRGKLLDLQRTIGSESFFVPDYGGFNGVHLEGIYNKFNYDFLTSFTRDFVFNHLLIGSRAAYNFESSTLGLTIGYNRISNRSTEISLDDFKIASDFRIEHKHGYIALEPTVQMGEYSANAFVIESKSIIARTNLFVALWNYTDQFIDLSSGSRSAQLSHTNELDTLSFSYSSRRRGQQGLFWDGISDFGEWELIQRSSLARFSSDTLSLETLTGLTHTIFGAKIQLDHLLKLKRKRTAPDDFDKISNRFRIEATFSNSQISWRAYAAFTDRDYDNEYLSLFFRFSYQLKEKQAIRVWFNLSQLNFDSYQNDYCYGYLEFSQSLSYRLHLKSKLSQSYSRSRSDNYLSAVSVELVSQW